MNKIASRFIGDSEQFTFAHQVFNFTLLMGTLMTFSRAMMAFLAPGIKSNGFYCLLVVQVWVFLYYLSRVRGYFKFLSIISFIIIIFIFSPISWITGYGSFGSFPYYAIVFTVVMGIVLNGRTRYILLLSLIIVVIGLIGLEYNLPGIIKGYGSEFFRYLDITINLIISTLFTAVLLINFSNKYNSEKEKIERYTRDIEKNYQQQNYFIKNMEQLINKLKAERDDFNYHLGIIYGLLEENDTVSINEYIKNFVENTEEYQDIVKIPYSVLGAMLNYKLLTAKEEKIELKLKINIPGELKLNEFDLTIITGYLLDNAIEACSKLEKKERFINLNIYYRPDYLVIQIENPQIEKQIIGKPIGQFCERQTTYDGGHQANYYNRNHTQSNYQENHKFGLSNIEYLVNKHDGFMKIEEGNDVYKVNIALLISERIRGI